MIRPSRLLLLDILLLQAFISVRIVSINFVARLWCLSVGLFEYLSTLMLICAQSGRVSRLVKKIDPATRSRSDKRGLNDNNNRLLGIVNKFCIPFGTKNKIVICGGSTVLHCRPFTELRISELSTLIQILKKSGGVYYY